MGLEIVASLLNFCHVNLVKNKNKIFTYFIVWEAIISKNADHL